MELRQQPSIELTTFFKNLLPKLPAENRELLKQQILEEGRCIKPLVTWAEQGVLIDGHHRLELVHELRSEGKQIDAPEIVQKSFPSRWEAALWAMRHQTAQRPSWSKTAEAMAIVANKDLVAEIEAAAEKRKLSGIKAKGEKGRTVDILAKMTGVGRTTIHNAKKDAEAKEFAKAILIFETAEATTNNESLQKLLKNGTATFENLMNAKKASDRAEQNNKEAIEARKQLPTFETVEGELVNQLVYGDAVETMKKIRTDYVNVIFTSPPYPIMGLAYGNYEYKGDYAKYLEWMNSVYAECFRVLSKGGYLVINFDNTYVQVQERQFTANRRRNVYADYDGLLGKIGFSFLDTIIWDKNNAVAFAPVAKNERSAADIKVSPTFEYLNVYRKGEGPLVPQSDNGHPLYDLTDDEWYRWRNKTWSIAPERDKTTHRCPFPLELAERVVRLYSFRNDIVLDPFVGSATTAVAAVKWGRRFIGIDNDPRAIVKGRERLKQAIEASTAAASQVVDFIPLTAEEKAQDVKRRFATVSKHRKKQIEDAASKQPRRNRSVAKPSTAVVKDAA